MEDVLSRAGVGLCSLSRAGLIIAINGAALEILGAEGRFGPRGTAAAGAHFDDLGVRSGLSWSIISDAASGLRTARASERVIVTSRGVEKWVSNDVHVMADQSGGESVQVVIRDITPEKKAIEGLSRSEIKYRRLVDSLSEGLGMVDKDEFITFANDSFARILGYRTGADVVGRSLSEFSSPRQMVDYRSETDLRKGGRKDLYEAEIVRSDGSVRCIMVSATPVFDSRSGFVGTQGLITDITERKKSEEEKEKLKKQLEQAQKMEAIGQLASGISHDFNNIQGVISGYAELGLMQTKGELDYSPEMMESYLQKIIAASNRAKNLTRQMLDFARMGKLKPENVNLNSLVSDVASLIGKGLSSTTPVSIECDLGANLNIVADETQIHQVVSNICINARDAMPSGGKIRISTRDADIAETRCLRLGTAVPGRYAVMSVSDTGCGIAAENLDRIFDPFFTTKDKDKGSGLGLAVVWGIVENHGGCLDVQSKVGEGTTFTVYFPAVQPGVEEAPPPLPEPPVSTKGRILVVDDEPGVRSVLEQMLAANGCEVVSAAGGREAIEAVSRSGFDLVLTDLIMAPMDGISLFHEIRRIRPDTRVLLMSGFEKDEKVRDLIRAGAVGFVAKPFGLVEMWNAVAPHIGRGT